MPMEFVIIAVQAGRVSSKIQKETESIPQNADISKIPVPFVYGQIGFFFFISDRERYLPAFIVKPHLSGKTEEIGA
jgi:hypothetical protein